MSEKDLFNKTFFIPYNKKSKFRLYIQRRTSQICVGILLAFFFIFPVSPVLTPNASAANYTVTGLTWSRDSAAGIVTVNWTPRNSTDSAMVVIDASGNNKNVKAYFSPGYTSGRICFPYSGNVDIYVTTYDTVATPTWSSPYSNFTKIDNAWSGGSGTCTSNSTTTYNYSIDFNSNPGAGSTPVTGTMKPISGNSYSVALPPNSFSRSGYTFTRWDTATSGVTTSYTDSQTITLSYNLTATLYAIWTAQSQTITYGNNGGSGSISNQTANTDASVTLNSGSAFSKNGYFLSRWDTATAGNGTSYSKSQVITMPAGGLDLYAIWAPDTYTVTYNYNNATADSSTVSSSYTTGGTAITLPTPTRSGYTFGGWYSDAALTTSIGAGGASYSPNGATLNLTAYAKWTANTLTVNFDEQGGSAVSDSTTVTGGNIYNPGTTTRAGYSFLGWFMNASGGSAITFPYTHGKTDTFTVYAQWSNNPTYTVSYNANGGSGAPTDSNNYLSGASVTISATEPTRTGYTFVGWNDNDANTGTTYKSGGANPSYTVAIRI